jgi:hypothetical protein
MRSLFAQAFAVIVTLSTPGGAAIPCTSGFAVLATVDFVASTPSGSQLTASVNVTLTCVPFAPTSPYRFTFVDEGDGSVQVRAECPGVSQLSVQKRVLDPTVLRYVGFTLPLRAASLHPPFRPWVRAPTPPALSRVASSTPPMGQG